MLYSNLPTIPEYKEIESNIIIENMNLIQRWNRVVEQSYNTVLTLSKRLHEFIIKSPNRPIKEMNFIEFFDPNEPTISRFLKMIFNYRDNAGNYSIFNDFVKSFLQNHGLQINLNAQPRIHRERLNIDLLIEETGKYAIIFENKLKGADFQRNQLARYIQRVRDLGYEDHQIYIVILPKEPLHINKIRKSAWCLPEDWKEDNDKRRCALESDYLCWCDKDEHRENKSKIKHCSRCKTNLIKIFGERTIILHQNFANWMLLEEKRIEPCELNVRSGLLQIADYLNGIYKTRFNHKLNMEITKFLRDELKVSSNKDGWEQLQEKLSELTELRDGIQKLRREVSHDLIEQWYNELKDEWPELEYKPRKWFGLMLQKKVWCGCEFDDEEGYIGDDDQPFWMFEDQSTREQPTKKQIEMVNSILDSCGLSGKTNGKWIKWDNTLSGASQCKELFKAAKELGYLE